MGSAARRAADAELRERIAAQQSEIHAALAQMYRQFPADPGCAALTPDHPGRNRHLTTCGRPEEPYTPYRGQGRSRPRQPEKTACRPQTHRACGTPFFYREACGSLRSAELRASPASGAGSPETFRHAVAALSLIAPETLSPTALRVDAAHVLPDRHVRAFTAKNVEGKGMKMTTTTTPGTIEHIDPQTIDVTANVRTEVTLGREFIDSIRANGVLQPVVAYRDSEGLHVRYGQRRTLAAQMVGLATMPVYVVDVDDTDTAQRIIEQLVENDQREALGEGERLEAWRQLELEGLSATQIAKRTGTKRDTIKTGLTVASSDTGTRLVAEVGLTLDQAATLIEFEDDPQAVADLTEIARSQPDYFPVAVQRARNERDAAALREKVEAEQAAKGHRIMDSRPNWDDATPYRLHQVTDEGGNRITSDYVEGKPGIAAHVSAWDAERFEVTYYVDDLDAAGLILRPDVTSGAAKGPMTDEQKAERKTLIANNKEWDAAEAVRREWVTTFLARKTMPKDAMSVVATLLATGGYDLGQSIGHGNGQAQEFLGIERGDRDKIAEYLTAHPTRATHVAVAIVLGGIEQQTSRDTWRYPRPEKARYFQTLQTWGYPLSPVEKIAAMLPDEN